MQIETNKLTTLEEQLVRFVDAQPPRALYTALLSLVDPTRHVASWTEWEPGLPTFWRCWFLTDSALAYVHLQFDKENYYRAVEEDLYSRMEFIPTVTREAWVLPLNSVVKVQLDGYGTPLGNERQEMPLDGLVLSFANGDEVKLPSQIARRIDERQGLDEFTAALRAAIPFWS
ncbi:hypothetical protein QN239_29295 [Mycolicibacterium sp. Y3]